MDGFDGWMDDGGQAIHWLLELHMALPLSVSFNRVSSSACLPSYLVGIQSHPAADMKDPLC